MRADGRFADEPISFWAYVRAISEALGYSKRGSDRVATFSVAEMIYALERLDRPSELLGTNDNPSGFALKLKDYFDYRSNVLNDTVRNNLMVAAEAKAEFLEVRSQVGAHDRRKVVDKTGRVVAYEYTVGGGIVRVPMNKQSGEMRAESFLTGMVNLLVAYALDGRPCDYDPRKLPVIDHDGALFATFSRRMDGSYPSTVNPIAMWEIKEYYYTTTFGSKISDAVYITSLDGYERIDLERATGITIDHLIIVDAYDTWWGKGKSYLCRMIDVLNIGHVDEILFGREVRRLPEIVPSWIAIDDATHGGCHTIEGVE